MNRTNFYDIDVIDEIPQFDHLYNPLSNFNTDYPVTYYRVTDPDFMRPDLISYQLYGSVTFWWIICYVNKIHSPLEELKLGRMLIIPNILDIYAFNQKWAAR